MRIIWLWILIGFFFNGSFSQQKTVFQEEDLSVVLPEIASFYTTNFSYSHTTIAQKKVSVLLDKMVKLPDLIASLSAQTQLKFEAISSKNIVISTYTEDDFITICGQLLNNEIYVENAVVKIDKKFYNTNEEGKFYIEKAPYNAEVKISSFGIKTQILSAYQLLNPNCKLITVEEKEEELDQVVIKDYITSGINKNVKQTTLYSDKLKILPGLIEPDVLESIHLLPGVSNVNETANSIYVRGGNSDQNSVLWNNIKVYNNAHLFGLISAFNPYVIDKVNFIHKGTNAKYGERISSVIDMQSRYTPAKNITGGAGFNMLHADAFLDLPVLKNKLSFQVSGRRSYSNVLKTFTFKKLAERVFQNTKIADNTLAFNESKNIVWFRDFTLNGIWRASQRDRIKINALHNQDYLNFTAFNLDRTQLYTDELDTKNNGLNVEWKRDWTPNFTADINAYYSNYSLDYLFANESSQEVFTQNKSNKIIDKGADIAFGLDVSDTKKIDLGYQFSSKSVEYLFQENTSGNLSTLDAAQSQLESNSFYATYEVSKPETHLFSLGARVNKYSISEEVLIEPRVNLQKFVTSTFSINASLEYKSQIISQLQESVVSNLSLENHVWALSRTNAIPILKSYQYTIGANYRKNQWVVDLEAYFKKIKGLSSKSIDLNNPLFFEYFEGASSVQGIDFFVKRKVKNYNSWLAYSFSNARYRFPLFNNGNFFPSNVNILHTLKWSHFYKWKNIEFSLGWLWHSGKPYTNVITEQDENGNTNYVYDELNSRRLPSYHRLDFSAVYDFSLRQNKNIKYRVGLSVLNVYNQNNLLNKDIRLSGQTNDLNISNVYGASITPNLTFRIFW